MTASTSVVVLDYGFGNVRSAVRALEHVGAKATLTSIFDDSLEAQGLVVPGVGAFASCMQGINSVNGARLVDARLIAGRPVLGICVGMQIMFERGIEHHVDSPGLGQWPGTVERLRAPVIPHMGWNTVSPPEGSQLFRGIEDASFYFVHSYAVRNWSMSDTDPYQAPAVVTTCDWKASYPYPAPDGRCYLFPTLRRTPCR
jgi:glutamine amidotransferase